MEELIKKLFSWFGIDENPQIYATTLVRHHKKIELSRVAGRTVLEKFNKAGSYPYLVKKFKKRYNSTIRSRTTKNLEIQKELPELMGVLCLIISEPSLLKILENKILLEELKKESQVSKKKKPLISKRRSKKGSQLKKLDQSYNKRNQKQKQNTQEKEKEKEKEKPNQTKKPFSGTRRKRKEKGFEKKKKPKEKFQEKSKEKEIARNLLSSPKFENDYFLSLNPEEKIDQIQTKETNFTQISLPISNVKRIERTNDDSETQTINKIKHKTEFSDWSNTRPYLNGTHLVLLPRKSVLRREKKKSIGLFPLRLQEKLIIQDLLYCLIGVEGKYINVASKDEKNQVLFKYDLTLDKSLAKLTKQILPLCNTVYAINRYSFIHFNYSHGKINHSLCSTINGLLKDYYSAISKFEEIFHERGDLTLQKLKGYLSQSMRTLSLIHNLIKEITELKAKGGMIINIIHTNFQNYNDDLHSRSLFLFLLERVCQPYLQMLENWLFQGTIEDPYEEFLIIENKKLKKTVLKHKFENNYWEGKYTIRKFKKNIDVLKMDDYDYDEISLTNKQKQMGYLPYFLKKCSKKLLIAGKYLNVIKECGIEIDCPFIEPFIFSLDEQEYESIINKIYNWSSEKLLTLLVEENQLFDHLEALKRYFLIGTGDWISHFIDLALKELSKKIVEVIPNKLVSFLSVALENSISKSDPLKDNLNCILLPNNLINQLIQIANSKKSQQFELNSDKSGDDGDEEESDDEKNKQIESKFTGKNMFTTSLIKNKFEPLDFNLNEKPKVLLTPKIVQQQPNITGIDTFALDYQVQFPLSIFINKKILTKYQIIFRHLFLCKNVEKHIYDAWRVQQRTKTIDFELTFLQSFSLIHKMLKFIQNLQYYMHFEVLEQNWFKFKQKIENNDVKSIDQLMQYHEAFLDTCLKQCLLTNTQMLSSLTKILSTCKIFANHIKRLTESLIITNLEKLNVENQNPNISDSNSFSSLIKPKQSKNRLYFVNKNKYKNKIENQSIHEFVHEKGFSGMVKNSEKKFIHYLSILLLNLQNYSKMDNDPQMADLIIRLDYNNYYSNLLNF
ncbi:gamma-tubulin complex component 2 [Anaeramoeba flamelloides]|uniref:Gamma-tubulin complex component 2 n=1 Tax=Anaeramoeba flamelloides TaxID=1746091 RepID=A0ABQ8YXZ5_9EUKA|nr:gamma-tubulin complex component 2 [Anaeramoeba flamelloides]